MGVQDSTKPQLRVFGRFAQADIFVALTGPADRAHCDYATEIVRCQQAWQNCFDGYSPIYGSKVSDYISGANVFPLGNP